MRDVSFIADVACCRVGFEFRQLLDYVAGVHPKFDRAKAEGFLAKTPINTPARFGNYRRMVAQLHLALVMAIDAKLLVLDERRLAWTSSIANNSTIRCSTIISMAVAPSS